MSLHQVKVPDLGSDQGIPVIELLVKPGDTVAVDDGLVTLESDKATMEVPATAAGVVKEVHVAIGDEVTHGTLVATIEEVATDDAAAPDDAPAQSGEPGTKGDKTGADDAGTADVQHSAERTPASLSELEAAAVTSDLDLPPAGSADMPAFQARSVLPDEVPYASPAVRRFARELGVDLTQVKGSGRKGRISRDDVRGYVKKVVSRGAAAGSGLDLLPWPEVDFSRFGPVKEVELSRIRKISGANLARNWAMIPHVTQFAEADITELEEFRKAQAKENPDRRVSPLVFQIKAVVAALKEFPQFNASLTADGERLVMKDYFHIGIAVDTPNGLVVPVIRDCDRKGLLELADELASLSGKARDGKLMPADMSGGCFSISSLGGIGGTAFTPIVNAPEVAILGVSRAQTKPHWDGNAFVPRLMLPLSLSYDHRVVDGADAARFCVFLAAQLADIRRLLL